MRHLKSFHVFHVAAEYLSYSDAAKKLNITHGAVSKQIKTLERYLNQALFYKQGRNVRLTAEGELLKTYTAQAFDALETGVGKLQQVSSQCLEVSCEPTLTMRWLMPRLSDFHAQSGGDVRLSTAGGPVMLGSNGLSMAIRRDDFEISQDYKKTHLVEEWVGPVFSPDYWQKVQSDHGQIKLLHSETRPHAWRLWADRANLSHFMENTHQSFAHFYFCIQAAVDGLGAAMGSYPLVMDDIQRGNLVAPFGFAPSGHDYVLLSQNQPINELEQQFAGWLIEQITLCVPNGLSR
ncbi:LysR family transcriptional regulator [Vibrio profundi]|uniref:LysR family transcriptional regulator n=1 Tax=Vibrio profundi TaxID=1774960 RepID=UPI003734E687